MQSRISVGSIGFAALLGCAAAANAQTPPGASSVAAARATAGGLIVAAGASDVFENITDSNGPTVRHKASGMRCMFNGTPGERLVIFASTFPRGDDVGCSYQFKGVTVSLDATRVPNATVEGVFNDIWNAMPRLHPGAKPYAIPGPRAELRGPNLPEIRSVNFMFEMNGQQLFSRLAVAVVNGWVVEERTTTPLLNARLADTYAKAMMVVGLIPMVTASR